MPTSSFYGPLPNAVNRLAKWSEHHSEYSAFAVPLARRAKQATKESLMFMNLLDNLNPHLMDLRPI
jgi:hypothetical protein